MKIKERILIGNILPKKGNFETMIISADIEDKVKLTQDELITCEVKSVGDTISWNVEKDSDKNIEFTNAEKEIIKKQLKELSDKGELTKDILEIYKLFI